MVYVPERTVKIVTSNSGTVVSWRRGTECDADFLGRARGDVGTAATRPQTRSAQVDDCSSSLRRYAQQSSSSRSCVASPDGSQQVDVDRSLVIIVGKYRAQMYMAATIGEEAQLPWRGVRPVHDF